MNAIFVTGRLGRDPEANHSKDETLWATVSILEGWGEEPTWFEVTCFDRTTEVLTEYCAKGRQVAVRGQIVQEHYQTKDGQQRKAWRLIADWIEFLDSRKDKGEADSTSLGHTISCGRPKRQATCLSCLGGEIPPPALLLLYI